jgi:hypothetical protein
MMDAKFAYGDTAAALAATAQTAALTSEPPKVVPGGPFTVGEGGSVVLTSVSNVSTTNLEWDFNYDGTFDTSVTGFKPTFSAAAIDGPVTRMVAVRAVDASGNRSSPVMTSVTVTDVAPRATFSSGIRVVQGKTGMVTFTAQNDPSAADRAAGFKYSYDFDNDGTFELSNVTAGSATVPASALATIGSHIIHGRITDKDGVSRDYTTPIYVVSVGNSDFTPPVATLQTALRVRSVGGTFYKFVIRYTDDKGQDLSTIDSGDIIVTGPGGFSSAVRLLSKTQLDSKTVEGFYRLAARDGTWDRGDNGLYTFNLVAAQLRDASGNAAAAGVIGQFTVRITKKAQRAYDAAHAAAATATVSPASATPTSLTAATSFSSVLIADGQDAPVWA